MLLLILHKSIVMIKILGYGRGSMVPEKSRETRKDGDGKV